LFQFLPVGEAACYDIGQQIEKKCPHSRIEAGIIAAADSHHPVFAFFTQWDQCRGLYPAGFGAEQEFEFAFTQATATRAILVQVNLECIHFRIICTEVFYILSGIPGNVLHFLPGAGAVIGAAAVADPRVAGVAFTGSMATAQRINRSLAGRDGPIAVLIAETGGQNTMIVDSSALPEQVVKDVVQSAFNSAGQRCSALRVLCLQEEIAPRVIELLAGYMAELTIGDPALLSTDIGPVIDKDAQRMLNDHIDKISELGKVVARSEIPAGLGDGSYVTPLAVEIPAIDVLEKEVFGPVLHIVRYKAAELDQMIAAINRTGFGLTLGVHSRIDGAARHIARVANVGNVYVNRNMVGAVVGVQPFGGCGLSGTGPKAGGPFYLHRFASEKTITINTAAVGGNASLLSLETD
ncbi:MAG: aldehyde dehydrogenase family protein, partial [Proteobacteria bacterium]|nr:aldehyde dehydrogenase family protein [Pseudomonadota bacterium]